jgi:hypothetical protein
MGGREGIGGSSQGFFEGFGLGEAFLPGLAAVLVEVFGGFEVVGLAGAVGGVVDQGAVHGGGFGDQAELALVVRAVVFGAEVDLPAFDEAGFGEGFSAAEGEADQSHEREFLWTPSATAAEIPVIRTICRRKRLDGRRPRSQRQMVECPTGGFSSSPKAVWLSSRLRRQARSRIPNVTCVSLDVMRHIVCG